MCSAEMNNYILLVLLLLNDYISNSTSETSLSTNGNVLLYPYGPAMDNETPKSDDGSSAPYSLTSPIHLFGNVYTYLYVNNNGLLSFNVSIRQYMPSALPVVDGNPFIAIFWADVNNAKAGNIYYRQSTDPDLLLQATTDIRSYSNYQSFSAQWVFVATWHNVAYFGSTSNKVNTFQVVMITDGNLTFILFNYENIQWPTSSIGDANAGLGGTPALAGLNSGTDTNYYTIPGSMSSDILNLPIRSNVNILGRWAFQADKNIFPCQVCPTITPFQSDSTTSAFSGRLTFLFKNHVFICHSPEKLHFT